jgi:hypothetical protein
MMPVREQIRILPEGSRRLSRKAGSLPLQARYLARQSRPWVGITRTGLLDPCSTPSLLEQHGPLNPLFSGGSVLRESPEKTAPVPRSTPQRQEDADQHNELLLRPTNKGAAKTNASNPVASVVFL